MERVIYSVKILLSILAKQTARRTESASGRLITKKHRIVDYVNHLNFQYHGLSFNLHREVFWICFSHSVFQKYQIILAFFKSSNHSRLPLSML